MSVQDDVRTVTVPSPTEPADPPLASLSTPTPTRPPAPAPAPTGVVGRDRPLTKDERLFVFAASGIFVVLSTIIVTFLLLAQYVWS